MKTVDQLDRWLAEGEISAGEHATLSAVAGGRRLSVYVELNAALYLGVLSFAGGLAWTARTYAAQLRNGRTVVRLAKVRKPGTIRATASYLGDAQVAPASGSVRIKVVKARRR